MIGKWEETCSDRLQVHVYTPGTGSVEECNVLLYTVWHEILVGVYIVDLLFLIFFPRLADYNLILIKHFLIKHFVRECTHLSSLAELNLVVLSYIHQSAKLTSPPIFHTAIQYTLSNILNSNYTPLSPW